MGLLLAITLNAVGFAQAAGKTVVRFISDPWAPWVFGKTGAPPEKGIAIDLINEIFAHLDGVAADFMLYPWNRCLKMVENGESDAFILCAFNEERSKYAVFTDEVVRNRAILIFRKGEKPIWNSLQDLSNYRIGVLAGNDYGNTFSRAMKDYGYKVDSGPQNTEQALFMLISKRFDFLLSTETSASEAFKLNTIERVDFEITSSPFSDGDIYFIAFSKKSSHLSLVPKINIILAQLKADGTVERIKSKY